MKLTMLFLVFGMVGVCAESYSQATKLNLDLKNATIIDLFEKIEEQSEFYFFYKNDEVQSVEKIDLIVKEATIKEILSEVFEDSGLSFKVVDHYIVVGPNNSEQNLFQEIKNDVVGTVTGEEGESIPGVSVLVKGTSTGTVTNIDGTYLLSNMDSENTLVFSFIGMKTQEVLIGNKTTISIVMEEETIGIGEIIAIGYGTAKKGDLTGSITTVSTKDFDKIPATTALQALQGRAAGIQITTGSGKPGAGADVLIRGVQSINGSNSPIYVVDGMITTNIDNLNPNSIESVSILKDASASAIYGARAANGVILVTTKRGAGKKDIEITLNAYYGFQTESNLKLNLMNANQFLELWTESYENAGLDLPWNNEILSHYNGVDTDWKSLMLQTGIIQNYDLSVVGGSEKSNYYVSASFLDQKGMVIETNFNKYTLTFNSDHKINDWIKFGNSLNIYSQTSNGTADRGGITVEPYTVGLRKVPITRDYEANGDYGYIYNTSLEHMSVSPLWLAKETVNILGNKGVQGNLYLTLELMKGLEFTARGSMDYSSLYSTFFQPGVPAFYGWERSNINSVEKKYNETVHWTSDFLLNYKKTINEVHDIKVLLGYSLEESKYEFLSGSRTGTPNNEIQYLGAGDPASQLNDNGFSDWAFSSMFGRLNYTFMNKYLTTFTIRRDGTSRLSKDNRFGIFPSASVAWRVSEEGFLNDVDFLDDLKIRGSYGKLGNILSVGSYGTIASLSNENAVLNQIPVQAYTKTSAVNSDLKWEEASKTNLGIDATFLNNKLYSTIDFFVENTYDLLFTNPIPRSTGLSGSPLINAGEVRNKGYELEIGYRAKKNDWSYNVSFNLSHVKNEVIDLDGRDLRTSGLEEGYPVNSFFGYKANGIIYNESQLSIYQEGTFSNKGIGDIALLDIDGYDDEGELTGIPDGKVTSADRTFIGNKYPDFIYGAMGTVIYKNWSLQLQLQGVQGIDMAYGPNSWRDVISLMSSTAANEDARILDRYHPTKNPTGTWPKLSKTQTGSNDEFSEFWIEDASYLRVKNINVNYNLPKNYCGKVGMRDLGVYVSVQNAYTFTKYGGPEVDTSSDPLTGVPQARTWTLGLKATF